MKYCKMFLAFLVCMLVVSDQRFLVYHEDIYAEAVYEKGDVNYDGKISALDYVALKNHLKNDPQGEYIETYDANNDGRIDESDLLRIKNIVYYGEVNDLNVSVSSKTIHTQSQKDFIREGYTSIKKYSNSGGYPAQKIKLEYGSDIISDGSKYIICVSENYDMSDAKQYTSYSRSVSVEDGKVHQLYFWTVSNGSETSAVQSFYVDDSSPRNMSYSLIKNIRDIGGYETEDGMTIRQGMIYRGYMLENDKNLNANRNYLKNELGIKTEIDLAKCTYLINTDHYYSYFMTYPISNTYLKPGYNSSDKDSLAKIFDVLADERNYPVYIHCHIGTDRTGFVCFLMNALCGVEKDDLYTDYVFSSFAGNQRTANNFDEYYTKLIDEAPGRTFAEKTYNTLVRRGVNPDSLDSFISIMRKRKANTKTYLKAPEAAETVLHYDGNVLELKLQDDYLFNVKGNKAKEVGTYIATVSLKDPETYSWSDGSKSDRQISWTIDDVREAVSIPETEIEQFIYDGEEKEIVFAEEEYYVVSGNKAMDAGDYEITVSLTDKSKYVWEDGSNDDLLYKWTIEKADIDLSQIVFEDISYEYDGDEKQLVYEGELPKGIKEIVYSNNTLIGNAYKESSVEAILSFVLESDNYNPVEDMKAVLTIKPIYGDITVEFKDQDLEPVSVNYGEEYLLPDIDKEGYLFDGWYYMIGDEMIKVELNGIWEYEVTDHVVLVPIFVSEEEEELEQIVEEETESEESVSDPVE